MNEKYLLKLQQHMQLKNFTSNTCEDYYRFVKRFLDFTNKETMSITYADIRKFILPGAIHPSDRNQQQPYSPYG